MVSCESRVTVLLVSLTIPARSNEAHDGPGVAVGGPGSPLSAHGSGSLGMTTFAARNSQFPESPSSDSKRERATVNPFPRLPRAKNPVGAATPDGESIRFRKCSESGTDRVVPLMLE